MFASSNFVYLPFLFSCVFSLFANNSILCSSWVNTAKFILVEEIARINCIYLCIGNFCWVLIHVLAKLWTSVLDKNYTMNGYVDVKQTQLDQC